MSSSMLLLHDYIIGEIRQEIRNLLASYFFLGFRLGSLRHCKIIFIKIIGKSKKNPAKNG